MTVRLSCIRVAFFSLSLAFKSFLIPGCVSFAESQLGSMTSLASSSGPASQSGSMIDLSSYGEGRQAKKLMRRDHLSALQRISEIEGAIEQINHFIESTKFGPDHQRYALLKEKEKLILELQRFELYVRTEEERVCFLSGIV